MRRAGFTLVELMIVVAIIGILAAIAIPNFVEMQYRAKRAEVPPNVDAIASVENAYEATFNTFLPITSYTPRADPDKSQVNWVSGTDFDLLGWQPDGKVRGVYMVTTVGPDYVVTGMSDVDDDDVNATYTATRSITTTYLNNSDTY